MLGKASILFRGESWIVIPPNNSPDTDSSIQLLHRGLSSSAQDPFDRIPLPKNTTDPILYWDDSLCSLKIPQGRRTTYRIFKTTNDLGKHIQEAFQHRDQKEFFPIIWYCSIHRSSWFAKLVVEHYVRCVENSSRCWSRVPKECSSELDWLFFEHG